MSRKTTRLSVDELVNIYFIHKNEGLNYSCIAKRVGRNYASVNSALQILKQHWNDNGNRSTLQGKNYTEAVRRIKLKENESPALESIPQNVANVAADVRYARLEDAMHDFQEAVTDFIADEVGIRTLGIEQKAKLSDELRERVTKLEEEVALAKKIIELAKSSSMIGMLQRKLNRS